MYRLTKERGDALPVEQALCAACEIPPATPGDIYFFVSISSGHGFQQDRGRKKTGKGCGLKTETDEVGKIWKKQWIFYDGKMDSDKIFEESGAVQ